MNLLSFLLWFAFRLLKITTSGRRDGLRDKASCHQGWCPELSPWVPSGGRRGQTPSSSLPPRGTHVCLQQTNKRNKNENSLLDYQLRGRWEEGGFFHNVVPFFKDYFYKCMLRIIFL